MTIRELDYEGYRIGLSERIDNLNPASLIELIHKPQHFTAGVLGGRTMVGIGDIANYGKVVIKHYKRGGIFGRLISKRYMRWGPTRAEQEFNALMQVRQLGVSTPEPLAFVYCGKLFYRAWLITSMVEGAVSLADLSTQNDERAHHLLIELVRQVAVLIKNSIYHVDLHPGNVLVDKQDNIYILDFDKAHKHRGTPAQLRDAYLHRWRRAVIKHNLPESLSEIVCLGLRKNYDRPH